jgi:hypothetical protein
MEALNWLLLSASLADHSLRASAVMPVFLARREEVDALRSILGHHQDFASSSLGSSITFRGATLDTSLAHSGLYHRRASSRRRHQSSDVRRGSFGGGRLLTTRTDRRKGIVQPSGLSPLRRLLGSSLERGTCETEQLLRVAGTVLKIVGGDDRAVHAVLLPLHFDLNIPATLRGRCDV